MVSGKNTYAFILSTFIVSSMITSLIASEYVAIVVPMRGREKHLQTLKDRYVTLANQHKSFIRIIVAEQDDQKPYNLGKSRNVGFAESIKQNPSHVVFNDVDTWLKSSDVWQDMVSPPIKNQCKILCYDNLEQMNGIFSFLPEDYRKTNGFPNDFTGWGCEDAVLYRRAIDAKMKIWNNPAGKRSQPGGRSCCDEDTDHPRDKSNLGNLLAKTSRWKSNTTGLSNLHYTVTKHTLEALSDYVIYEHIWFT